MCEYKINYNAIVSLLFTLMVLNDFPNLAGLSTQCHFCNLYQQENSALSKTRLQQ